MKIFTEKNNNWLPYWASGFMFTLGYSIIAYPPMEWWQNIFFVLITWILWPMFLGAEVARLLIK